MKAKLLKKIRKNKYVRIHTNSKYDGYVILIENHEGHDYEDAYEHNDDFSVVLAYAHAAMAKILWKYTARSNKETQVYP